MIKISSFYFDGSIFQAVKASLSGDALTIEDAQTFPQDQLDGYLSGCREKSFILCCNPLLFHQDIIHLPPAAARHYDKLVRTEVGKLHPELTSFTTWHSSVGQTTIDSKVHNKIAAFSYLDDSLAGVLGVFNRHGKVVSHLYAAPYSVFRLFASTCLDDAARARIFIASLPGEKLLLVAENNQLEFIRKIPSSGAELLASDIQGINMTLDYSLQTLRVRPVEAVRLDQSEASGQGFPLLSVPLESSRPPILASLPGQMVSDYLAPVAAALHYFQSPRDGDILPADYACFTRDRKILSRGTILMIALALALATGTATQWMVVSDLKSGISTLRSQLSGSRQEIAAYGRIDAELKSFHLPQEIARANGPSLHPASALASLNLAGSREYALKGISLQQGTGFLGVHIEGIIDASGFGNIQAVFEGITDRLARSPGYAVTSSTLDIKQKTFSIQARYHGKGDKGR